jgi:thioredoxin 1
MRLRKLGWLILPVLLYVGTVANAQTTLLDFYSDWCGPCQSMAPTVDQLARDGYAVRRVNIDQDPQLAEQYGVTSIPCFVVLDEGKEVDRMVGAVSVERLKVKLHRRPAPIGPTEKGGPKPAWRYERPVGHRAAVVRIYCQDSAHTRSIGSGVLVRWNMRIAVLTARHVVQDAKRIVVELCNKRTYEAHVMKMDAVWDCAVLVLAGEPDGIEPADVELGEKAMQQEGSRLESCGYGPDGQLACNSGLFLGYKRSTQSPNGPDDWMEISGHARQGDSGGPIFNTEGHVVGVLWGTDGEHVVGVQAGRVERLLDAALPAPVRQQSCGILVGLKREPTPALPGPEPYVEPACPLVPVPAIQSSAAQPESARQIFGRKPIPQPPQVIVQSDPEVRHALGNIDAKVGVLIQDRQAREQTAAETKDQEPSPLLAGLCILAAVVAGVVIYFATQK